MWFYDVLYYENDFLDNIDLNKFRDINMDDVVKYLTKGRGKWIYKPYIWLSTNFNQEIMSSVAKMWMQFIGARITLALNVSNVNTFELFSCMTFCSASRYVWVGGSIVRWSIMCVVKKLGFSFPTSWQHCVGGRGFDRRKWAIDEANTKLNW